MRLDDSHCHPPLSSTANAVIGAVPGGRAFVLALAAVICNSLHRNSGPLRAVDCATCRHAAECSTQMSETLVFTADMNASVKAKRG